MSCHRYRINEPGRTCCDGLCVQGRQCPAFAPGVIDGPHRTPLITRLRRQMRALVQWFREPAPWQ